MRYFKVRTIIGSMALAVTLAGSSTVGTAFAQETPQPGMQPPEAQVPTTTTESRGSDWGWLGLLGLSGLLGLRGRSHAGRVDTTTRRAA